jgi:hypothetical protein
MTDKIEPLDLASLDTGAGSDNGAEIELKHPTTRKPLGIFIGVLGKHGQTFRETVKERQNETIRKQALAERQGLDPELTTAEQMEASATDLLVACTTGWRTVTRDAKGVEVSSVPTITFEGKPLEFSVANARLLYTRLLWIRTQVDEAIGNLELFIPA